MSELQPIDCPECGAMTVMFADSERNDYDALGLRCSHRCGWELTFGDLLRKVDKPKKPTEETRDEVMSDGKHRPKSFIGMELLGCLRCGNRDIGINGNRLWPKDYDHEGEQESVPPSKPIYAYWIKCNGCGIRTKEHPTIVRAMEDWNNWNRKGME